METNVIGLAEIASEIFAIDPGPAQSAWLEFDLYRQIPKGFGIVPNPELLHIIYARDGNAKKTNYVIEMVAKTYFRPASGQGASSKRYVKRRLSGLCCIGAMSRCICATAPAPKIAISARPLSTDSGRAVGARFRRLEQKQIRAHYTASREIYGARWLWP